MVIRRDCPSSILFASLLALGGGVAFVGGLSLFLLTLVLLTDFNFYSNTK